ncbi:hypothetical protein GCM10011360_18020 [Primorskyibacter flagellatus]|uniref:Polynucleotide kinase PNKP phosphatase domain-containing protein n=1 Tax=Primorskyibacter flagellatus TaxID=1387277 RepID=A0A917EEK6_9RHOB|nr:HAD family acid phosphatase [Primorskyibacter flagellatus]GGE30403.1 hypothetical protein GCM10011360_18020 [Primorskyibacter flagellatus]
MIVFDLDGTLADPKFREHYVRRPVGQKDWDRFHAEAARDLPKAWIVRAYLAFEATGHEVQIWTGRDEKYRQSTLEWLAKQGIHSPELKMRQTGDHTPDDEMKSAWADEADRHVQLVFEDRQRVVDMWRSRGVTCCQVAPGDF